MNDKTIPVPNQPRYFPFREIAAYGLSVVPCHPGKKRPLGSWAKYQETVPTQADLAGWEVAGYDAGGFVCGDVSGGLEALDFDQGGAAFQPWSNLVKEALPGLLARLVVESTPSGGRHVLYRCGTFEGNLKLASRERKVLIETRGEGGFIRTAPTPGYSLMQGGWHSIPTITTGERDTLLNAARSLDEPTAESLAGRDTSTKPATGKRLVPVGGDAVRLFNEAGEIGSIIKACGWQHVGDSGHNQLWRRPGKEGDGHGATWDGKTLFVHSSNAGPFEGNTPYSRFDVHALLNHSGDTREAARQLEGRTDPHHIIPQTWPDPIPFVREFDPPSYPADTLPEWFRNYVVALSGEKAVPLDLPVMIGLSVLGAGIARKVVVRPWDGWEEPVNLYTLCALEPGERKSQTFSAMLKPVRDLERELRVSEDPTIVRAESEHRVASKRVAHLEEKLAKEADPEERGRIRQSLEDAQRELSEIFVPPRTTLQVDDETAESLTMELIRQGGRLLSASAEAKAFENIERYSDKPNFDVFLKGHAGDDLKTGRVGRGRDECERPALSCAYTVQPSVVRSLGDIPGLRDRGFVARWFYSLPASLVGFRDVRTNPVPPLMECAYRIGIGAMWGISYASDADCIPWPLTLEGAAQKALEAFLAELEEMLRPYGSLKDTAGWGNKAGGLVVRLTGILHVADHIEGDGWKRPIPAETVMRAVRIVRDYAVPHALAAFDLIGQTPAIGKARRVLRWIKSRKDPKADFAEREAFRICGRGGDFATMDKFRPILDLLAEHHFIRTKPTTEKLGPGRKPSRIFEVHAGDWLAGQN